MSSTSDLVDAVVSAINAAVTDGTITRPISIQKKYVVNLSLEGTDGPTVIVKAGKPSREPLTLDGSDLETLRVRLLVEMKLNSTEESAVEPLLDLVETLLEEIEDRVPSGDFLFMSAEPEDDGPYDEDKLLHQRLFYSLTVLEFKKF